MIEWLCYVLTSEPMTVQYAPSFSYLTHSPGTAVRLQLIWLDYGAVWLLMRWGLAHKALLQYPRLTVGGRYQYDTVRVQYRTSTVHVRLDLLVSSGHTVLLMISVPQSTSGHTGST